MAGVEAVPAIPVAEAEYILEVRDNNQLEVEDSTDAASHHARGGVAVANSHNRLHNDVQWPKNCKPFPARWQMTIGK